MTSRFREFVYGAYYSVTGRGAILRNVRVLDAAHRLPRERAEMERNRRLHAVVARAIDTVPYYREWSRANGFRARLDTIEDDLRELPLLSKEVMREEGDALRSDRPGRGAYPNTSGGSTGEPVRFFQDEAYKCWSFANKILFMQWTGYQPGDWHVKIWGARRDMWYGNSGRRAWVHRNILREILLPCWEMNAATWREHLGAMVGRQPYVIEAYVDAIHDFSRFLIDEGLRPPAPLGIVTSAGVLTPPMREAIEAAWGCRVLNRYGSREVGDIACSCESSAVLHVSEMTHYVEVLDEEGGACPPGIEGDVVITLLTNHTMPLLRFRIGDRAAWAEGECPCGRTSRRLAAIVGRTNDCLIAADGTRVNGVALTTVLYKIEGIKQYQFHQSSAGGVVLCVVPRERYDAARLRSDLGPILGRIQGMLGPTRRVELVIRDVIEVTPTGKHRYVISELLGV